MNLALIALRYSDAQEAVGTKQYSLLTSVALSGVSIPSIPSFRSISSVPFISFHSNHLFDFNSKILFGVSATWPTWSSMVCVVVFVGAVVGMVKVHPVNEGEEAGKEGKDGRVFWCPLVPVVPCIGIFVNLAMVAHMGVSLERKEKEKEENVIDTI